MADHTVSTSEHPSRITFGLPYWLMAAAFLGLAAFTQCSQATKSSVAYQIARGAGPIAVAEYCQIHRPECLDVEQRYGPALRGEGIYAGPSTDSTRNR